MSCKLLAATFLAALLLLSPGIALASAQVWAPGNTPGLLPDLDRATWLVAENRLADTSLIIPWKDAYVEAWQTTGLRQGEAFCRAHRMSMYKNEKFLIHVFRLLNNGRVFQVTLEIPNTAGVRLVDSEGKGVFSKAGSVHQETQMPAWAEEASGQPKTFHPLPVLPGASDQGIQKMDIFPQIPGKETTVHRYRTSRGDHVFVKYFSNHTVWGYDFKRVNKPQVSYWARKWNRSYDQRGSDPKPEFADYGLTPR